ncbi:hypothetical protein ABIA85_010055, partial [Bradyrhizobium sp. LA6.10]|uniref:hypothetical protein n=1 Tax=Bradyrhizobium sp. LA6.10 TaxID=3156318 RepID=UPI0033991108
MFRQKDGLALFKASNCVADRTWWVYSRPIFGSRWVRCGLLELDHTLSVIKRGTFGIARAPRRRRVFCCYLVVREELAAAPGSSGVSSRDGLEEGSDDDTQEL